MNRNIFEPAESAKSKLAKNVQAEERNRWHFGGERVVRSNCSAKQIQQGKHHQYGECSQHDGSPRLVQPFADSKTDRRNQYEKADSNAVRQRYEQLVAGDPLILRV